LIPILSGLALFAYAFWGSWERLLERKGIVRRIFYLLIFIALILLLLDVLTGIIPTSIRSGGESVIFPL
jgi:cytochrome c biogenesis protein ResB